MVQKKEDIRLFLKNLRDPKKSMGTPLPGGHPAELTHPLLFPLLHRARGEGAGE